MGFSANSYFQFFQLWLCSLVTTAVSHKYRLDHSRAMEPALGWDDMWMAWRLSSAHSLGHQIRQPSEQARAGGYQ